MGTCERTAVAESAGRAWSAGKSTWSGVPSSCRVQYARCFSRSPASGRSESLISHGPDALGDRGHGGALEDVTNAEIDVQLFPNMGHELRRQERVPSELEEVVVDADAIDLEDR